MAPLSALSYVRAFYVYDLLMLAAMVGLLAMLRPLLPRLAGHWYVTVVLVVCFHPIIRNIIGGQNTVLTTFLLTGTYVALRRGRPVVGGLFLGLLLYKPQFAVPLLAFLLIRREWRVMMSAGAVSYTHLRAHET